jgi:hypothetical protein
VHAADVGQQRRIAQLPRRRRPGLGRVVRARGDLAAVLAQHATDRLNPTEASPVLVDEPHECVCGRSSSAAKKAEAAFKISFARRSSAFLPPQPPQLHRLLGRDARPTTGVDLRLPHPLPQHLAVPIPSLAATAVIVAQSDS